MTRVSTHSTRNGSRTSRIIQPCARGERRTETARHALDPFRYNAHDRARKLPSSCDHETHAWTLS
eukprot:198561-Prorocentrum_minimum.AAC.3